MMTINPDLYVGIEEMANGPAPLPSRSGFSRGVSYKVLGGFTMSESAEMFFLLANDRDEPWFISNRHCRVESLLQSTLFRIEHKLG